MQTNPASSTTHKGFPVLDYRVFNEHILGLPTGEHTVEVFMSFPCGDLSYVLQNFWIQRLSDGNELDLEASITAGTNLLKLGMDGPEDITFYVFEISSETLGAREKFLFETQDRNWLATIAKQAFDEAQSSHDLAKVMQNVVDQASAKGIKCEQKYFRVTNDLV